MGEKKKTAHKDSRADKLISGIGQILENPRAYLKSISEEQTEDFLEAVVECLKKIDNPQNYVHLYSPEMELVHRKLVFLGVDPSQADKVEAFACALVNSHKAYSPLDRMKFIEILRLVSKPALEVLATALRVCDRSGARSAPRVSVADITHESLLSPYLVEACVHELYALGVFSNTPHFDEEGRAQQHLPEGEPAFTDFSRRFLDFITPPS